MKIPAKTIDLGKELGYDGYFVKMPKSVREGWIHDFQELQKEDEGNTRLGNIRLLELVEEWNLDDETGSRLPLVREVEDNAAKGDILSQVPVDVLVLLANSLTNSVQGNVKDFSSKS